MKASPARKLDSASASSARAMANAIRVLSIRHMVEATEEMYPHIPICLHQDHGNDESTCLDPIVNVSTAA